MFLRSRPIYTYRYDLIKVCSVDKRQWLNVSGAFVTVHLIQIKQYRKRCFAVKQFVVAVPCSGTLACDHRRSESSGHCSDT
jgi:hypothetical protein